MAKNNCRKGFVEIPQMTLNALKGLLFNSENGADLSAIINDLRSDPQDELTAINVGLVYKRLVPKIDTTTRYKIEWKRLYRYEFIGTSLILGVVKVRTSVAYFNESSNSLGVWEVEDGIEVKGFDEWLEMGTSSEEPLKELVEKYGKKPQVTI